MKEIIIFYVPCGSYKSASNYLKTLIQEKLVACGNIIAAQSAYFWEGDFCEEAESILIMKTTKTKEDDARSRIQAIHDYDLPCIASWTMTVNEGYGAWIAEEVTDQEN